MYDFVIMMAFSIIALAIAVRTVFYAIEVFTNLRTTKKSFKIVKRLLKAYEPMLDAMRDKMDDLL